MSEVSKLNFKGFECSAVGMAAAENLTQKQWEAAGQTLGTVEARLNWYVGDWLRACKGEAWGYGELEDTCKRFDLNYDTARVAMSVCGDFQLLRRRNNLTFSHHREVQGRTDADELLDWCEETTPPRSRKELREKKKAIKNIELSARDLPKGKYSVIYVDPPWEYNSGDQHANEAQDTVLGTHYPSMPLELICQMPVADLAADGCALFIWATSPTLEECFHVINAWGFEYKTSMVWDKVKHNVGHYVSVRHELLLICRKGQTPHVDTLVDSVYEEERTVHSRKPEHFRKVIEQMYPNAKRLELFARQSYDGWEAWGNEV